MKVFSPRRALRKFREVTHYDQLSPVVRRILASVIGTMVLLAGVAMIVLPGPAFVFIPAGLAILALEFSWPRRWLARALSWVRKMRLKLKRA